nr:NADH dehydrogenase subunit 2 [Acanthurus nigroris]
MNPILMIPLVFGLGLGTMIALTSSHWLIAWMGLEISTIAIIPLMAKRHHPRAIEAATKYFLTQATGAALLLFATMVNAWLSGEWDFYHASSPIAVILATLALALKMGIAPLHAWLPEVLQGVDLITGMVISTWQKLAPFALLIQIEPSNSHLLTFLGLTSTLVGGWGGLNQTQLRKILAYSSIAHLGWVALAMQFSKSLALLTLLTYIVMAAAAFLVFNHTHSTDLTTLAMSATKNPVLTAFTPLILFSLGGLPPLTGFFPKWMILQVMVENNCALMATIAAMSSLLSLYVYLRIAYAMTLTMSPGTITCAIFWVLRLPRPSLHLATLTMASTGLLPIAPVLITVLSI